MIYRGYRGYQGFKLTPIWVLIIVNFVLVIATMINRELFISSFGLMPVALLSRPWTIVTSMFIHAGLWHFITNMLTLYFFGTYLSRLVGENRFLLVYFGGGILGNIFFILLGHPFAIAVGASGAIFALMGTLAVMRPKMQVYIIPIPVPVPIWIVALGGFLILSLVPFIAWQAHLGGLVLGLIVGYFFRRREGRYIFWSH